MKNGDCVSMMREVEMILEGFLCLNGLFSCNSLTCRRSCKGYSFELRGCCFFCEGRCVDSLVSDDCCLLGKSFFSLPPLLFSNALKRISTT